MDAISVRGKPASCVQLTITARNHCGLEETFNEQNSYPIAALGECLEQCRYPDCG